jgi:hypothetical protein
MDNKISAKFEECLKQRKELNDAVLFHEDMVKKCQKELTNMDETGKEVRDEIFKQFNKAFDTLKVGDEVYYSDTKISKNDPQAFWNKRKIWVMDSNTTHMLIIFEDKKDSETYVWAKKFMPNRDFTIQYFVPIVKNEETTQNMLRCYAVPNMLMAFN